MNHTEQKPITVQRDLTKLPRALAPLIERPQWAVWRWTQLPNGKWQKPPFMAVQPDRHASTNDAGTWSDYATALAAVQAGYAEGISYILTKDDPFAAIDLDHCRCTITNSIDVWAQNWLDTGRNSYQEVTPSGQGVRIWGLADGDPLNKKFTLKIDDKPIAAELFRRTGKALTITGYTLDPAIRKLSNIDKVISWGLVWGERRKAAAAVTASAGNGFDSSGCKYSIDEIERIVREGPPGGANRSDVFHTIVGHYVGCGWQADRIFDHLQQHPHGIGERYIAEDRLRREVERSAGKYAKSELPPWSDSWEAKAPEPDQQQEKPVDPELEDDELEDGEELPEQDPNLPRLYAHGDPDPRPIKSWLIKGLVPAIGHGLMSGQWGAGKTFAFFDLAASLSTGQPFIGHTVKRQCGILLIAAEGADEVRLRLDAVVREKCGNMTQAPFRWYETAPVLLQKGATEKLIAMARQAEASLQEKFGLPLGLIGIDTIAASAGYARAGDEYDTAVGQSLMNVLRAVAQEMKCFVLGIDHFGKSVEAGTRGASSKEASSDVVLACLGNKELSGSVTNTRLAVRKHRGGQQGQEYPFTLRKVEAPEKDEDGDSITTMVVDWLPPGAIDAAPPPGDKWAQPKRQDQRTVVLRLRRVLMAILADQGVELPIEPDGPVVRMVEQELVRKAFFACTPAAGTPEQTRKSRHMQFTRALGWAEGQELIGMGEIEDVAYVWLARPDPEDEE
jgi:AAA domain